jgi:hypothetical protein
MARKKDPTFTITITMGNHAMRTLDHVADALHRAAMDLRNGNGYCVVRDENGNVVGGMTGPTRAEIEAL